MSSLHGVVKFILACREGPAKSHGNKHGGMNLQLRGSEERRKIVSLTETIHFVLLCGALLRCPSKHAKASSNHDIKVQDLCSTVGPGVALLDAHMSKQKDNLSPYRPTYNREIGIRNNNKLCSGHQPVEILQSYYKSIDQFPLGLGAFHYEVGPVNAPESHAPVHCSRMPHCASGMTFLFLHPSWPHFKRVLENLSSSIIYLGS